jgi:PAS domain S-box-containing protein
VEALAGHHRQLEVWSENCRENFESRAALVAAEIARIEGRELDAQRLYEQAIRSAQANGLIHNEALARELAARFYEARGFERIAHCYLQDARSGYLRWGADGKVRQLDELYPQLGKDGPSPGPMSTIGMPVDHLDLETVIEVSQTVSREIVLETLIDTIMRMAVEQAGAARGVLVVSRGGELWCVAEASTGKEAITVELRDGPAAETILPLTVLQYAMRTREAVILDDAAAQHAFAADPYFHQQHVRSVLCMPLLAQARLGGLLYLENNLAPRVFVQARAIVLKLLASQAAIALENASLYRDIAKREAEIRRLVDANIIGTFIWKSVSPDIEADDILIIEANDAFLRMVGYDRDDIAAGRLSKSTLTPPEWHARDAQHLAEVKMTGTARPFEKEYLRKDGTRVPVLLGIAAFDEQLDQGVAFVIDLTERKRAEAEAHEAQMELAHANRVAAIGQLSASIGHEINQPLSGVVTNAETGLLWLKSEPPNLPEAEGAFSRVVRDGKRVSAIVNRIRALVRKAPPQKDRLDINEAIHEVVGLTRSEAAKSAVLVRTQLGEKLPPVQGDRIQLQQVILNLVVNAVEAIRSRDAGPREIFIGTAQAGPDDILVSVRDTGPGFENADIERVFNAFFTTKADGLGLGLSICRSIIDAHGGRLWATPAVPQGAVFQFTLPGQQD